MTYHELFILSWYRKQWKKCITLFNGLWMETYDPITSTKIYVFSATPLLIVYAIWTDNCCLFLLSAFKLNSFCSLSPTVATMSVHAQRFIVLWHLCFQRMDEVLCFSHGSTIKSLLYSINDFQMMTDEWKCLRLASNVILLQYV